MKLIPGLFIILLASCGGDLPAEKQNKKYYLLASGRREFVDTIPVADFPQYDSADQFIAEERFVLNQKIHIIKAFSSDNHAPVDGGRLYYILDSIGVIYSKSTTWPVAIRLSSNNDSLNDLISATLAQILLRPLLHCYHCDGLRPEQTERWKTPAVNR